MKPWILFRPFIGDSLIDLYLHTRAQILRVSPHRQDYSLSPLALDFLVYTRDCNYILVHTCQHRIEQFDQHHMTLSDADRLAVCCKVPKSIFMLPPQSLSLALVHALLVKLCQEKRQIPVDGARHCLLTALPRQRWQLRALTNYCCFSSGRVKSTTT